VSDFVRDLDAQLLAAARRLAGMHERPRPGWTPHVLRPLERLGVAAGVAAIVVAIAVTVVPSEDERAAEPAQQGPAPGDRPVGYNDRPPESNLRYAVPRSS